MDNRLPQQFVQTMTGLLGPEADAFFSSYRMSKVSGLRVNALKLTPDELPSMAEFARTPVPWAKGGYYTKEEDRPGKHPFYHLGLYYIQEPSAMLPAELLGVRPGHRVLDLCAAPGGKSTQLAAKLEGEGVLVSNDIAPERTKALAKNVELAGVRNAIVMNEKPDRIADRFGSWFDRVLVDAPCSGEGMFRKDEDMVRQWERQSVGHYAKIQLDILREAARMVAAGGRLVYSTCTFNPMENEGTVARFLAEFPDFRVIPAACQGADGLSPGRPDWLDDTEAADLNAEKRASLAGAVRIWPHRCRGEGHFAVLLERQPSSENRIPLPAGSQPGIPRSAGNMRNAGDEERDVLDKFERFRRETLPEWMPPGKLTVRGRSLYAQPEGLPSLNGLNAVRPGWHLGTASKHRFEPSQALAMGLQCGDAVRLLKLTAEEPDVLKYLKGETLQPDPSRIDGRGWTLVCVAGYPAGWGRWDGTTLKNERPPGWRWV